VHLVVVGGSYIGLEFAQAYRRFGARVTVVEMGPRLIAWLQKLQIGQVVRNDFAPRPGAKAPATCSS